jgi:uncharacterized double-CXXCG motif protein
VDLSGLAESEELADPHLERDFARFEYLRERVRPFLPEGAALPPGTNFGPLVGKAWGRFGLFAWRDAFTLLARREVIERLQAEGVRGLKGCATALRFRHKEPPDLLELELHPYGRFHEDCLPERPPPCGRCGRDGFTCPAVEEQVLEAASLPAHVDLFRLGNFATQLFATERFVEAVQRLGPCGVRFREVPTR